MLEENFTTGYLPDNRSEEEKAKDYHQSEFVTAPMPVVWEKKTTYRSFPVRKQAQSGSCWAQATEKERGIIAKQKYGEYVDFSATLNYQQRGYPPVSGSTKADRIAYANRGSVLEALMASQSMTDEQMNTLPRPAYMNDLAKVFGAKTVDITHTIDDVASTIQATGKGVCVCFRFGPGEWFYLPQAKLVEGSTLPWGHAVVAVDFTLNDEGKKCLVIEDSACEDGFPQRLVPEDFFNARCFEACYLVNFKTLVELPDSKPRYEGTTKSLQDILKYEGLFPANQESTGVYGPMTTKSVILFQKKYGIEPALGYCGPLTQAKIYQLYP